LIVTTGRTPSYNQGYSLNYSRQIHCKQHCPARSENSGTTIFGKPRLPLWLGAWRPRNDWSNGGETRHEFPARRHMLTLRVLRDDCFWIGLLPRSAIHFDEV
jgi:hypothetical protein